MTRSVVITGALLVLAALGVVALKVFVHELPLAPADTRGMWQVQTRITLRGSDQNGNVVSMLPPSDASQVIFGERTTSAGPATPCWWPWRSTRCSAAPWRNT